tara:strand:+ start:106 stop:471 length:366 start_codon:yes stop_codon:yes gene_type:complete
MKITKQRLREIIKEELSLKEGFPGAELVTQFVSFIQSNPEVAIAANSANAAGLAIAEMLESIALKVRDTKKRKQPHEDDQGDELELEEYRSTGTGGQSAKDREKPARPSSDTRSSNRNYRG